MTTATYDEFIGSDPTETYAFKVGLFLDRLLARITVRVLVEIAHLLFLKFYDDLGNFLHRTELAEAQSRNESEYTAISKRRIKVAQETARLVEHFESIGGVTFEGKNLVEYLVGRDRLQELKLFVKMAQFEEAGERILVQARRDFFASFGRRRLNKMQRTALLEKRKELSQLLSAPTKSVPQL